MHALLILDMQVGLLHGPDKPLASEALITTLNALMSKARIAGAPHWSTWFTDRTCKPADATGAGVGVKG